MRLRTPPPRYRECSRYRRHSRSSSIGSSSTGQHQQHQHQQQDNIANNLAAGAAGERCYQQQAERNTGHDKRRGEEERRGEERRGEERRGDNGVNLFGVRYQKSHAKGMMQKTLEDASAEIIETIGRG